jgi:KTSC domain
VERVLVKAATTLILLMLASEVQSETVDVKYRGPVDLKTFECQDISRSSFIQRVCYDQSQSYMIISLKGAYYHYCELPPTTFDGLMSAPSMGQFYNQNIKGIGLDGPYDCRTHRVPK